MPSPSAEPSRHPEPRPGPRLGRAAAALSAGLVLVVLAVILFVFAGALFVRVPGDLDRAVRSTGTAGLLVDPGTLTTPATPSAPFTFTRVERIRSRSAGGPVLLTVEDQRGPATQAGTGATLPAGSFTSQYAVDGRTGRNVPSPSAWVGDPRTTVDRSPAYSPVQLPFSAGAGPYSVWDDEVGAAVPLTADGTRSTFGGVTVHGYALQLRDAPLSPTYAALLPQLGLPDRLPLAQAGPLLRAGLAGGLPTLLKLVDAADAAAVGSAVAALQASVPLDYRVSGTVHVLVEPTSGAVLGVDRSTQTISAVPRLLPGAARLDLILRKQPGYRTDRAIATVADALAAEIARPTATALLTVSTAQTAASIRAEATAAGSRAGRISAVTTILPIVCLAVGLVLVLAGLWIARGGRRRRVRRPAAPAG